MKRIVLITVLALMLASAVSAGEGTKLINLYIQGGVALPQSDFKDGYKMGYQGAGKIGLAILPLLEPCAIVSYNYFPMDYDAWGLPDSYDVDGGEVTMLTYGLEAKLNLMSGKSSGLFALAGFGIVKVDMKEITVSDGTSEYSSGDFDIDDMEYLTIGAGIDFGSMYLEARYMKMTDDVNFSELDEEVDEDASIIYIPISLGFRF
ncbi:MAG TPA: hypothetical protein PLF13_06720 [candidate division Zixibacteria bacterium]|nr:hypothetical protein [candidate division Zixibacteria bacterium]